MNFIRSTVFGRPAEVTSADSDAHDLEAQPQQAPRPAPRTPEMQQQNPLSPHDATAPQPHQSPYTRFLHSRPTFPFLSGGRSPNPAADGGARRPQRRGRGQASVEEEDGDDDGAQSPKTPTFSLGLSMPSTRLHLPNLTRTWTRGSSGPLTPDIVVDNEHDRVPLSPAVASIARGPGPYVGRGPQVLDSPSVYSQATNWPPGPHDSVAPPMPPMPAAHSHDDEDHRRRRFRGVDPAEVHLAELAETGRRRRRRKQQRSHSDGNRHEHRERHGESRGSRERRHRHRERDDADERWDDARRSRSTRSSGREPPKRFLFCFPWVKSRRVRNSILRCFVSGIILALILTIYLALSITKNINNSEFTVLIILIILVVTIFFCHSLIRLCMAIVRPRDPEAEERRRLPNMLGPGGYAIPREPIRVVLARDEEAAGIESETTKMHPPAYGLWRESVRVDPNRIYWQRNEHSPTTETVPEEGEGPDGRPSTARRPPSYASDDGVEYAVEARPRSMAPLTDVPLRPHPSEAPLPTRPSEAVGANWQGQTPESDWQHAAHMV